MPLKKRIAERNSQARTDALIEIGFGLVVTVVVSVVIYYFALIVGIAVMRSRAFLFALIATLGYLAAGVWSAGRGVDPMQGIRPEDWGGFKPTGSSVPGMRGVHTEFSRGSIATYGASLVSGPARLIRGWRSWQRQLPTDDAVVDEILSFLDECRTGLDLARAPVHRARVIAQVLDLIRERTNLDGLTQLELTQAGKAVLGPPER